MPRTRYRPLEGPEVVVGARRAPHVAALCGARAYTTKWTIARRYVSCPGCIAEIERRLAERRDRTKR